MADPFGLPEPTEELNERASKISERRLALAGDNAQLRERYDEIMKWLNPPWDDRSRRVDPRPLQNNADRAGNPKMHSDWVGEAVMRWAVLQAGALPAIRTVPRYVPPPLPAAPGEPPDLVNERDQAAELDRGEAEAQASMMEAQVREWMDYADFHRWWLWTCWAKEAFGKAIARSGWDVDDNMPTIELMENPSQVYYAWTNRYGRRKLGWVVVADQMTVDEANFRYGLNIPMTSDGAVQHFAWTQGSIEQSELDQRPEQTTELDRYLWVEESWELTRDADGVPLVRNDFVVAGRVVAWDEYPGWERLPFHVFENHHIPTYSHGKSVAETIIPLNEAYDDTLDRQHTVIEFESGPRYKGLNMAMTNSQVEIPDPGWIMPLRDGEDVQQIDTRVDFFPTQLHVTELKDSLYMGSGLTPIAWGMSPNAQTSGRALNAEWRAVQLPLTSRLIQSTPELMEIIRNWWDYAESFVPEAKTVAAGHRRFQVIWEPIDIRDQSEIILSVIQQFQADLMDPETALEKMGHEDVPEKIALIEKYLQDELWNPLRKQQLLVLRQLALQIRSQELELQAAGAPPEDAAQQGENAAVQQAQGPSGVTNEGQNQPGATPGAALPIEADLLSRTPLDQGVGNQIQLSVGGAASPPSNGQAPR